MKKVFLITLFALISAGCGSDGSSCSVVDNGDGTSTIICDDGTSVTISNGEDGQDGEDGTKALVKTSEEPSGENCPNGGIKIESGIDDGEGNFVDEPEVTYICDGESGEDGTKALVKTSEEPPGENCPNGGVKIESGIDNGDGDFVDEPEVTYVCDGESGEDGVTMLMITEELGEGDPECPTGGLVVHTGADTNENGILDEAEITSTNYLCNGENGEDLLLSGILEGSYTIRNNMDVHFLSSITEITGDLIVNAPGMNSLELPVIETVGGSIELKNNPDLVSVSFPVLTSVGGGSVYLGQRCCNRHRP